MRLFNQSSCLVGRVNTICKGFLVLRDNPRGMSLQGRTLMKHGLCEVRTLASLSDMHARRSTTTVYNISPHSERGSAALACECALQH